MRFYLGTGAPNWLSQVEVPLFVSHRRLHERRTFPRAAAPWALDSGGFTELSLHGRWTFTPAQYAADVARYADEVGQLDWACPQDWMCTPGVLERTGLTVAEHQRRTVDNYLELRQLAPQLPFIPMLQGITRDDFHRCVDLYSAADVDLTAAPTVGVGSIAARQASGAVEAILTSLKDRGLRLHGLGVKTSGLQAYADQLASADSMSWSFRARRDAGDREARGLPRTTCGGARQSCSNCLHFALEWREQVLSYSSMDQQLTFGGLW